MAAKDFARSGSRERHEVRTGDERLDLRAELVPLVRQWLQDGVSAVNLASSTRVEHFQRYGGGLKSPLVGEVQVNIRAVVKLGDSEMLQHRALMNAVNDLNTKLRHRRSGLQDAVFPEVMLVRELRRGVALEGTGITVTHVMLMQGLQGYQPLDRLLFHEDFPVDLMRAGLHRALSMIQLVHSPEAARLDVAKQLGRTSDPFSKRIRGIITSVTEADPELAPIMHRPGRVLGRPCPPIAELLDSITSWLRARRRTISCRLVHGDCHLGNIMLRRRGRSAVSARLIDPNPTLGITDPAYDYGKFLHFLEPVGWVRARPESCSAHWTAPRGGGRWCLDAEMQNLPRRREMARSAMEADIHRAAERSLGAHDSDWKRALGVATASAHLGLARLAAESGDRKACRFALAYALRRMVG